MKKIGLFYATKADKTTWVAEKIQKEFGKDRIKVVPIEQTWQTAATQIKDVVNNVVFPVVDCVLAVLLFVKLAMSYFEYKKHGEFEFTPAAILFFGLVFALTAPLYIWDIIGI